MPEDVIFCVTTIPGPQGSTGATGAAGTNGVNAYTTTTAAFTMPAEGANVALSVGSNAWASVGQVVYVTVGGAEGYFEVASKTGTTTLTLTNLENTASGTYAGNSAPATVFASGATVSPAGLQGPTGAAAAAAAPVGGTYIVQTPDATLTSEQALSLLGSGFMFSTTGTGVVSIVTRGTADTNVAPVDDASGLTSGEAVFATASGIESLSAANARSALGLTIGLQVMGWSFYGQELGNLGASVVADTMIYNSGVATPALATLTAFARTLLDDVDAATARATLGITSSTNMAMLLYRQESGSGVAGAAFTTGSWTTVPLNTEVVDTGGDGSITANEITLAAGTYRYRFGIVGAQVNKFQGRLYNVTDAGVFTSGYGTVVAANSGTTDAAISTGVGRFTLATSKTIRLEGNCETTGTYGIAASFGGGEIYSWIELWREST